MLQQYNSKNAFTSKRGRRSDETSVDSFNNEDFAESVRLYYNDLSNIPTLTVNEEHELIEKHYKDGVFDSYAKKRLIEGNLKFVFLVASSYRRKGIPLADLISQGNEGLVVALDKFDISKGCRFYCYALWWIRAKIGNYIESITKKKKNTFELFDQSGRCEISAGEDEEAYTEDILPSDDELSDIQIEFGDDEYTGDITAENNVEDVSSVSYEDKEAINAKRELLQKVFGSILTDEERMVIQLHYGFLSEDNKKLSVKKVGERLNIKPSKVKSIKDCAMKKMKLAAANSRVLRELYL